MNDKIATNMADAFATVEEAARALCVSRDTIRRRIADGTLKARKFGRRVLVCRESILAPGDEIVPEVGR